MRYRARKRIVGRLLGSLGEWLLSARAERLLCRVPAAPSRRRTRPVLGSWSAYDRPTPVPLRTVPGIRRDPAAEREAHVKAPLRDFHTDHDAAIVWILKQHWHLLAPRLPRMARIARAARATASAAPVAFASADASELTHAFRAYAARIGLAVVGVAPYDEKYHYIEYHGLQQGDRVVVGFVEQSYEAVQRAPSPDSERSTFEAQTESHRLMTEMAGWLHGRGYRAAVEPGDGQGIVIHYAVQAGLGQLGLNGQLLTPQAGSRCRPTLMTTNAPLELDSPVDYGIPRICDACLICVQRCPTGAIPARRWMTRGVEKAKINAARCLPVMGHAFGCAICMKVCPVQKYGLAAVTDELERSGRIVGKGSDDLESYVWPVDGRRYGAGAKPSIPRGFTRPDDLVFDAPRYVKPPRADVPPPPPSLGNGA